ncbi:MAG: hypothetical protein OXU79_05335 [Gemmatimonadota bacterium]|nr:hypothetical protein [Gemmatimonadota bacterium]
MNPVFRLLLIVIVGLSVITGAVLVVFSEDGVSSLALIAGGELAAGGDGDSVKGTLSERAAKIALGNNANAVLSLDLIADGGAGNRRDDGVTAGAVSGRGTKIAIEVFATGVRTTLAGVRIRFDFDASLLSFVKAENSAFPLSLPEGSTGASLASASPVTLASSGFLARAEFETVADVSGREFSIGIESVTVAESPTSSDVLRTSSEISFNAAPSADFDGDGTVGFPDFLAFAGNFGSSRGDARYDARFDLDGDGTVAFSDFLIFAGAFGSQVPPSGSGGGGGTPPVGSPDLIVESPSVNDNTLTTGQSFTLGATVRNQGNAPAAATTLRYFRSSNATVSTDDTEVGTDAVSTLSAGANSPESIVLNAPSSAGTSYYGACVDDVSDESDTGNNCSGSVTVTVTQATPSGFAPANQNAFNRLAVGKRILAEAFFVDVPSAGRFTEGLSRHGGRYTYTNTGPNTGNLTQIYDDSELFGGRCVSQLTFTSATSGNADTTCDDGTEGSAGTWEISDLSTPIFVRASADTLHFAILATWRAGQTRAYDLQLRTETPQGRWNDVCVTYTNRSDESFTAYAGPWIYSPDLEPSTTYEFRYRYRNSSSCDTGSPGPWSPIVEGTTADSGTGDGGGGGGGSLGACRAGLVVDPGETCTYKGNTFSVSSSGRGSIAFFSAGTGIDARGATINGVRWNFHATKNSGSNSWTIHVAD